MTNDRDDVDLDSVIGEIRAAVEAKRAAGVYSEAVDEEFRSDYTRMLERPDPARSTDELRQSLVRLDRLGGFAASRIDLRSRVPGGELVHQAVGKIVSRQILGLVEQLNSFTGALMPVLHALGDAVVDANAHHHADLVHELDSLQDRCVEVERSLGRVLAALDVDAAGAGEPSLSVAPGFAIQRGPGLELVPPVVDLALIDDARRVLGQLPPSTVGTILLLDGAERLGPTELIDVVALAHEMLRPTGRLIIEALNPQSLVVHAHALWRSAGGVTPLDPDYVEAVMLSAGFSSADRSWLPLEADSMLVESVGDESALGVAFNRNVERLNELLFAPPRYRMIATR